MTSSNKDYSLEFVSYTGDSLAAGTDAQTYVMGLSINDFKNTSVNYSNVVFDVVDGSLSVTPKPVVLTVTGASKTYGDKDPAFEYSVKGLVTVNGVKDELKNVSLERETGENVGEYAITATIDADANPNYTVTKKDGLFTINPDATEIIVSVKGHSSSVIRVIRLWQEPMRSPMQWGFRPRTSRTLPSIIPTWCLMLRTEVSLLHRSRSY